MGKEKTGQYWRMVISKAWQRAWDKLGVLGIIVAGLASLFASWHYHRQKPFFEIFGEELMVSVIFFIVVYALIVMAFALIESSDIYYQQREKLILKEYNDVELEYYPYLETDDEKRSRLGIGLSTSGKKMMFLVDNNGHVRLRNCGVVMTAIEYKGRDSENSWVNQGHKIETKTFQWDVGYPTENGRIDINPGNKEALNLAITHQHDTGFYFVFLDGVSKVSWLLEGEYHLSVQIDGQVEKDGLIVDLEPIPYDILFEYYYHRPLVFKSANKPTE
jgi:hypothetical protein